MGTRKPLPEDSVDNRSGSEGFFITRRGSVEYIVSTCGPSAFAVYSYLLQCANHQTGRCDPGQRAIAAKLKMARNTVSAALSALVTEGIIQAKYTEQPKYTSTRWVLKDIGTKARKALRGDPNETSAVPDSGTVAQNLSQGAEGAAQEMSHYVSQKTLEVAQNLSQGGSKIEPKIEEGNREEERESLSSSSTKTQIEPATSQIPSQKQSEILERTRCAEFLVAALYGDIKGVPNSTWGFVTKQLKALEWPPQEDLDGFVKWWRGEFPTIKLTLGAISPKNWPSYLSAKANTVQKYQPRRWTED